MGSLQHVINQALKRLQDTNLSQRIALLLGGALVAISLLWMAQWAATPELVPLLDQDLKPEELASVRGGLEVLGERYEIRGGRVYVSPTANHQAILAHLQQSDQLPADTSLTFKALVEKSDPWISMEENNRRWTLALQTKLEAVLSKFQGVQSASVFLNLTGARRGFSKSPPSTSAGVTLIMKGGATVPRQMALAAAKLVAGAVPGLQIKDVQVLDATGRSALDWESEHDVGDKLSRLRLRLEQHYTGLIRRQVPDPKALVSVVIDLVSTASESTTQTPIEGVTASEDSTSERTLRKARNEQPGVQPNVGVAAGSGLADESTEKETSKTEFKTGMRVASEATPAGDIDQITAAISLSTTYLAAVYRQTNPDAEGNPTDDDLEQVFQRERDRLSRQIARLVRPQTEDNVDISRYYDAVTDATMTAPSGTLDQTLEFARRYGAQSGLGLLALVSLAMMLRLARRTDTGDSFGLELGLPKEAIEAARQAAQDVASVAGRVAAGRGGGTGRSGGAGGPQSVGGGGGGDGAIPTTVEEAAATEGMLVAREVDAGSVQTRKMLDQVAEMVDDDPETVAGLVRQWVERSDQYGDSD